MNEKLNYRISAQKRVHITDMHIGYFTIHGSRARIPQDPNADSSLEDALVNVNNFGQALGVIAYLHEEIKKAYKEKNK